MNEDFGKVVLRICAGLLFLVAGLTKLINPSGISAMLGQIGFPIPTLFGWLLLLSEVVFGGALILGYKARYAVWPLMLVLVVALFTVHIPNMSFGNGMSMITVLFHLLGIAALLNIYALGPGSMKVGN
ncbi:MAG: DoxX family protein [Candidatus Woesearchaeota archaeon]|nr:DoxX family protein [Candidatus Woesearchaeota archaeon]